MRTNFDLGKYHAAKGNNQQALVLIRRAADLGYGDAVKLLEQWYRIGSGPVQINVSEAETWKEIYDKHNLRGMKRFTIPVTFTYDQSGDSSELAPGLPCKGKSLRNRGVSQIMLFLVIPRSLLRGGFILEPNIHSTFIFKILMLAAIQSMISCT